MGSLAKHVESKTHRVHWALQRRLSYTTPGGATETGLGHWVLLCSVLGTYKYMSADKVLQNGLGSLSHVVSGTTMSGSFRAGNSHGRTMHFEFVVSFYLQSTTAACLTLHIPNSIFAIYRSLQTTILGAQLLIVMWKAPNQWRETKQSKHCETLDIICTTVDLLGL